jgi:hypothetical protein
LIEARNREIEQDRETIAISDNSLGFGGQRGALRQETQSSNSQRTTDGLRQAFKDLIPNKPYYTNDIEHGVFIRPKLVAITKRLIQLNGPSTFQWIMHDIDRRGAYYAHEEANLPPPNFIATNPDNGHAHAAYLLATPVARHSAARVAPLRFYAAVELGTARRLDADRHYSGLIIKNPLHDHWGVEWRRQQPYTLQDLLDWLWKSDMAPERLVPTTGAGRNVVIFDHVREVAYREVLKFKRDGLDVDDFQRRCEKVAGQVNQQFVGYVCRKQDGSRNEGQLHQREIKSIAKSVARWAWRHFNSSKFSAIQSARGKRGNQKRWAESSCPRWQPA